MKKRHLALIAIIGLISIVSIIFFIRNINHKQPAPYRDTIEDSLVIIRKNIKINRDSTLYWNEQHQIYRSKKDSVERLDSLHWSRIRDSVRSGIRADVRKSLRERAP